MMVYIIVHPLLSIVDDDVISTAAFLGRKQRRRSGQRKDGLLPSAHTSTPVRRLECVYVLERGWVAGGTGTRHDAKSHSQDRIRMMRIGLVRESLATTSKRIESYYGQHVIFNRPPPIDKATEGTQSRWKSILNSHSL
jgi:hypothetical protein